MIPIIGKANCFNKSRELQAACKELGEITSVASLAGYEVLTEGRGLNAGTCILNLKPWEDRTRTTKQIIEELEEKCRSISNVKLEFFEPRAAWEQGLVRFGQFFKVYVQASPDFRRFPEDLDNMFVKNDDGEMVPYSAFLKIEKKQGLNEINRYNLYPTAISQGAPAAGYSSGEAIKAIQEVATELPSGFGIGWQGLSYDEANNGNLAIAIFMIVVIFVYLVLVGQYESFLLPLAVIASLPIGLFGSFFFLKAMGLANDLYAQIGLVMLVGLLGKNAILIIEFAVQRRHEGVSIKEAGIEGGQLRFRPILMTSFAFIAGLIPLVRATGPGAIGNRTIGTIAAEGC